MPDRGNEIILNSKKPVMFLLYFLAFLVAADLTGQILKFEFGYPHIFGLVPFFDFNSEQNLPTLFSTVLLIISGVLFFILAYSFESGTRKRWIWIFCACILFFLALDEFSEIHENLSKPFHELFSTSGIFYYAWVIPYGIIFLLIALFLIPAWWKLEKRYRFLMALSGFIYVLGALGFEMLGGKVYEEMGDKLSMKGSLLAVVEESLEMGGLILLIYVLLEMISKERNGFKLMIKVDKS